MHAAHLCKPPNPATIRDAAAVIEAIEVGGPRGSNREVPVASGVASAHAGTVIRREKHGH